MLRLSIRSLLAKKLRFIRIVFLADGRIVDEMFSPTPDSVLDRMKRFEY